MDNGLGDQKYLGSSYILLSHSFTRRGITCWAFKSLTNDAFFGTRPALPTLPKSLHPPPLKIFATVNDDEHTSSSIELTVKLVVVNLQPVKSNRSYSRR